MDQLDRDCLVSLIDVGRGLMAELEPEALLRRILDVARELTGARYAALGILDERGTELSVSSRRGSMTRRERRSVISRADAVCSAS
jgi:hypothetical protein